MRFNKIVAFLLLAVCLTTNAFAALSAVVVASPNNLYINQQTTAIVAITNTGAATTLSSLNITATFNGVGGTKVPAAFSVLNLGPNSPTMAIAVGTTLAPTTTNIPMQAVFFAPSTGSTNSGSGQFYIGANFSTTDGTVTSAATAGRVTVHPLPFTY